MSTNPFDLYPTDMATNGLTPPNNMLGMGSMKTATGPSQNNSIFGMPVDAFSSALSQAAGAFAPYKLDRWGKPIPSWQGELAKSLSEMFKGKQTAAALQGTNTTDINKVLLAMLMGGGK